MTEFKKISCENCGGELIFSPGTQLSSCNFCGSEFNIQDSKDTQFKSVEKILPFSTTKEEFEIAALEWLSEGDLTPDDILESSMFNNQVGVYLPMWMYAGRYDGSWSASSGYLRQEEYLGKSFDGKKVERKTRTVTDWRPSNGNCKGDFQFLATASADSSIPSSVKAFSHNVEVTRNNLKDFKAEYSQGFSLLEIQLESDECWDLHGEWQANHYVESVTKKRIPGDKYKDFYVDAVYDLTNKVSCYVPFWLRNYKYSNEDFHLYMDGSDTLRINGERPIDKGRSAEVDKLKNQGGIGCGVAAFIGFIPLLAEADEDFSGPFFWIMAVVGIIWMWRKMSQKDKLIQESKDRRQVKLEQKINAIKSGSSQSSINNDSNTPSF
jgi:hypothetical protein